MKERSPSLPWLGIVIGVAATIASLSPASPQILRSRAARHSLAGNEHYAAGRYREALQAYRDAVVEESDRLDLQLNMGNALYQLGDYEGSLAAFGRVRQSDDGDLVTWSWYNAGNALFQQREYGEATRAYTRALRRDPTDDDARANLELALNRLHQLKREQQPGDRGSEEQEGEDDGGSQENGDGVDASSEADQSQNPASGDVPESGDGASPHATGEGAPGVAEQMSREEALQLLEALEDRDREAQRLRFSVATMLSPAKDW